MDLATLGIGIRSDGMVVALDRLDELERKARKAEGATNSMSDSAERAIRAQNQLSNATRTSADSMGALASAAKLFIAALAVEKVAAFTAEAVKMRAQYDMLGAAMKVVGENVGYTQSQMTTYEKGLQQTGIAMLEARQNLTRMAAAHLDLTKATELGRVAQNAARIANISSSETFERMIHGIVSGQVEIFKTMGIMVNLEQAHKDYAKVLGKNKDDLTQYEKAAANMNAVLAEGAARQGVYTEAMKTAGGQLLSFKRYFEDFKTVLGGAFQDEFRTSIMRAADAFKELRAEIEKPETQASLKEISKAVFGIGDTLTSSVVPGFRGVVNVVGELSGAWNKLPQDLRNALVGAALGRLAGPWGAAAGAIIGATAGPHTEAKIAYYDKSIAEAEEAIKNAEAGGSWSDRLLAKLGYTGPKGTATPSVENLTAYRDRLYDERMQLLAPQSLAQAMAVHEQDPLMRNLAANRNAANAAQGRAKTDLQAAVTGADLLIEKGEKEAMRDPSGKLAKLIDSQNRFKSDYEKTTGALYQQLYFPTDDASFKLAKEKLHELESIYAPTLKGFQKEIDATTKSMNQGGKEAAKFGLESRTFLESVQRKMESVQGEFEGENYVALIAKVGQEIDNLQKRIDDAKIEKKGDLGGYLAAEALLPKLKKEMEKRAYFQDYEKGLKEAAAHEKTMAELSGGNAYEAENKALRDQLDLLEMKRANGIDSVKLTREEEEVRARIKKNLQEEATWRLQQKADYAQLTGNARGMYAAQAEQLRIQIEGTEDLNQKIILTEKLAETSARAEMRVGDLMQAGLNKASIKAYDDLIDKIENALPSALDQFSMAVTGNLTSMITGAVTADQAFANMINTLKTGLLQIIIELGMAYLKMEALAVLSSAISGTNLAGSTSAGGAAGAARTGTSGSSSSLTGLAGEAGKYGLSKLGGSLVSKIDSWGMSALGIGSPTGYLTASSVPGIAVGTPVTTTGWGASSTAGLSAMEANIAAKSGLATSSGVAGGLASSAMGVLGGIGGGYMVGSYLWPNGTGTVGSLAGGAAGAGIGLAVGGPIGAVLGGILGGGLLGGLTGSETKTTTKTGESGITINMMTPGSTGYIGWEGMRTVTSGFGGSQSTKHYKAMTMADPELTRAWDEGMTSATRTLADALDVLSVGADSLKNFSFPIAFDVNASVMNTAITNISNAMAEYAITQAGLKEQFDEYAKDGEVYIDELKRLSSAYNDVSLHAEVAGTSLEKLSGGLGRIGQAAYASALIDRLGSAEAVQNAFNLSAKYNVPAEDQYRYKMNYLGREAGSAIGRIGAQGLNVTNFWGQYENALNTQMSPDDFKKWSSAASLVDAFYESTVSYLQEANTKRIAVLQKETAALQQNVQVVQSSVNVWGNLSKSLGSALTSIKFDKNLSNLSPQGIYEGQYARYQQLSALAKGGDQTAMQELASWSRDFLEGSQDYWGATARYYDDFNMVTDTLTTTKSLAEQQYDIAVQQYNALVTQIEQNERTIIEIQNASANIANSMGLLSRVSSGGGVSSASAAAVNAAVESSNAAAAAAQTVASVVSNNTGPSLADLFNAMNPAPAPTPWFGQGVSTDTSDVIWGGRAAGGPMVGGKPYLVGERGPEIVLPAKSGRVISNEDSSDIFGGLQSSMDTNTAVSAQGFAQLASAMKEQGVQIANLSRQVETLAKRPH